MDCPNPEVYSEMMRRFSKTLNKVHLDYLSKFFKERREKKRERQEKWKRYGYYLKAKRFITVFRAFKKYNKYIF